MSQASTWDMRSIAGPLLLDSLEACTPIAASTPVSLTTLGAVAKAPLSPAARRVQSPSLLGAPPLDVPVVPVHTDASRLRVTKAGGCTFVNQYMVVQYLGRGTSGRVFLCLDVVEHRLYAVKIVRKQPNKAPQPQENEEPASPSSPPGSGSSFKRKRLGAPTIRRISAER